MKFTTLKLFVLLFCMSPLSILAEDLESKEEAIEGVAQGEYILIVEGYDWGPSANKVILSMDEMTSEISPNDFSVVVARSEEGVEMSPAEAKGIRKIVHAYVSDENGNFQAEGAFVTLVLLVSPTDPLSSPMKYIFKDGRGTNKWIDYHLTITNANSKKVWDSEKKRIMPQVDKFDLTGTYSENGIDLTYAAYSPKIDTKKVPLIIWLHGGGEGGTDTSVPLIANKATNYASDEIQLIFGGAHVLVPQSPTFWMQSASGQYTRGKENDIYNVALMGLIKKYVLDNPDIDEKRIYIGGCSNGGYMSLKLIMEHPDYFAAAYISALAFHAKFVTDEQIESIKNIPIWFLHCKDDPVTKPEETVVPLYKRLTASGAGNVHFSFYDNATDITGFFGGKDFRYNGHFSWIYSHSNHANFGFDDKPVILEGKPVSIMEWLSLQRK